MTADRLELLVQALGLAGLVLLTAALARVALLPWALLGLGAEFVVGVVIDGRPVAGTIVYAGGLLAVAELAAWSLTLRAVDRVDGAVVVRQVAVVAAAGAGGAGAAALALGAARTPLGSGLAVVALGVVAAVALVGTVAVLVTPPRR